jgi:hypothetical protein
MSVLVISLGCAGVLQAQGAVCGENVPEIKLGSYAEYNATSSRGARPIRVAAVGKETKDGKAMTRIEMQTGAADQATVLSLLTESWPFRLGSSKDVVVQPSGRPAMQVEGAMLQMMQQRMASSGSFDFGAQCDGVALVGPESVTVPAGTFQAKHYHNAKFESDVWVSADVPFLVVKSAGKDFSLELKGSGMGAKPTLAATPAAGAGAPGGPKGKKKDEEPCDCR